MFSSSSAKAARKERKVSTKRVREEDDAVESPGAPPSKSVRQTKQTMSRNDPPRTQTACKVPACASKSLWIWEGSIFCRQGHRRPVGALMTFSVQYAHATDRTCLLSDRPRTNLPVPLLSLQPMTPRLESRSKRLLRIVRRFLKTSS